MNREESQITGRKHRAERDQGYSKRYWSYLQAGLVFYFLGEFIMKNRVYIAVIVVSVALAGLIFYLTHSTSPAGIDSFKRGELLWVIGTNGEIVLGNKDWLICASSSAGPAFEGSCIRCGMRAGSGAIESLNIINGDKIQFKTIGDSHPIGICESGLLYTLSELFVNGIVDRTGRLNATGDPRLTEGDDGMQFQLVEPQDGHREIAITQADISNLIRSKAGVFAAIRILMNSTQTKLEDIDAIYMAGGFGNFLNVHRAITIGMLPDVSPAKLQFVGNTSIAGAKTVLMSRKAFEIADRIAESMTYFDLMSNPDYMDEFIKAKFLPHTELSLFPSAGDLKSQTCGPPV